jgi:hypothetical protein
MLRRRLEEALVEERGARMVIRRGVKVEEQRVQEQRAKTDKAAKRRRVLGVEVEQRRATPVVMLQDGTLVEVEELRGTPRLRETVVSNGKNG